MLPQYLATNLLRPIVYSSIVKNASTSTIPSLGKKKKLGKIGPVVEKVVHPVETDTHKLVNFVCGSNILKEGGKDIELKLDNEYPDWLWKLHTGKPKTLEDLDPDTPEYWIKVRKLSRIRSNTMSKLRKY